MDQSNIVYIMDLVNKESELSKRVTALELAEKNFTANYSAIVQLLSDCQECGGVGSIRGGNYDTHELP